MKLQDNFTTAHQSKRLLKLGVPKDSADMYLVPNVEMEVPVLNHPYYLTQPFSQTNFIVPIEEVLPCWSAGRLIEILRLCILDKRCLREIFEELEMCVDEVKSLVQAFYDYGNVINFSKLEE